MRRQDRKKDDDTRPLGGLGRWCDARAVCWSMVIPLTILLVLLVRSRTSRWGLGTQSERALRFDRSFRPAADPPDMDPSFDPEGDAARIRADTAAKAQAQLDKAQKRLEQTEGSQKGKKSAKVEGSDPAAPSTKGAGSPGSSKKPVRKRVPATTSSGGGSGSGGSSSAEDVRADQSSSHSTSSADSNPATEKQQSQDGGSSGSNGGGNVGEASSEDASATAMMSVTATPKARPTRRRKTDLKFVVVPAHKCQLLDDPLANACMYGGLDAANKPECHEATKGQSSNSYLPAFTRVAPFVSQHGLRKYSVAPVWDGSTEEARKEWKDAVDAADVLILDELAILYLAGKLGGKKLIALQHDAAASMRTCQKGICAQRLLRQERILGYLQHTSLVPLTRNNAPRVEDIVHFDLLDGMHNKQLPADELSAPAAVSNSTKPAFSKKMLSKVYTIVPMLWRWRYPITCKGRPEFTEWMMKALQGGAGDFPPYLRPIHERPVDVAFYGTRKLTPGQTWRKGQETANELFTLHRHQLYDSLTKLDRDCPEISVVTSESVDYETFAQGLRNAKMFISPLGKAEASGKDYEAIISRAVLLKPLASQLKSYPDIYEPEITCVEVKPDYSDLEDVVKGLLGNPERMQRIADTAYQRMLAHSSERPVAQDVAETMMDIVEADDPANVVYID